VPNRGIYKTGAQITRLGGRAARLGRIGERVLANVLDGTAVTGNGSAPTARRGVAAMRENASGRALGKRAYTAKPASGLSRWRPLPSGHAVFAAEFVHSTGGVDNLLLPGIERVAGRADVDMQLRLGQRRAGLDGVTAAAGNRNVVVVGMRFGFHDRGLQSGAAKGGGF